MPQLWLLLCYWQPSAVWATFLTSLWFVALAGALTVAAVVAAAAETAQEAGTVVPHDVHQTTGKVVQL